MGYDMEIVVLKKKTLEEAKRMFPDHIFGDMYSIFLFSRLYPDEYAFPEDEEGRVIVDTNLNIFRDFFEPELKNDEAIIVDKDVYCKMIVWLEEKLKSKTLFDFACAEECDACEFREIISVYKKMKSANIDFMTEFIVYRHDW